MPDKVTDTRAKAVTKQIHRVHSQVDETCMLNKNVCGLVVYVCCMQLEPETQLQAKAVNIKIK